MKFEFKPKHATRTGAMLPLVAVTIIILLIAIVFSIDIAYVHVTRAELRTATDAAARAAVESLGREQDLGRAVQAALNVARENLVAGQPLTLDPQDIVFGVATPRENGSFGFTESGGSLRTPVNAAQVTGARNNSSPDGPVGFLFGPLFGQFEFQPVQQAVAARSDRDIALVLDVSGSMNSQGRIQALRSALRIFLSELQASRQDVRVSLSVYSTSASKLHPLTQDLGIIQNTFDPIFPGGLTAIGEGLQVGMDSIANDPQRRLFAQKSILLMTDGRFNRGINPLIVARTAEREGVEIQTVTFSAGANQSLMREVAQIGNGDHFHALSDAQLSEVFREIAQQFSVILIK